MISFHVTFRNPWSDRFVNLWNKVFATPFLYKYIEIELYKDSSLLSLVMRWSIRESHAGLHLSVGILGYCAEINYYDCRHWDYKNKCWTNYSNNEE